MILGWTLRNGKDLEASEALFTSHDFISHLSPGHVWIYTKTYALHGEENWPYIMHSIILPYSKYKVGCDTSFGYISQAYHIFQFVMRCCKRAEERKKGYSVEERCWDKGEHFLPGNAWGAPLDKTLVFCCSSQLHIVIKKSNCKATFLLC